MKLKQMMQAYATYSPDDESGGEPPSPVNPPPVEPAAPVAKTFSQDEVNAIVARERSAATRKAKRTAVPPKEETSAPSGMDAVMAEFREMREEFQADRLATANAAAALAASQAFASDTAALTLSDDDKSLLSTLKEHNPDAYARQLATHKAAVLPPDPKGPGVTTPGAPSGESGQPDPANPTSWTRDDINAMKKAGTFRENLMKSRNSMAGGRGGLFPSKR